MIEFLNDLVNINTEDDEALTSYFVEKIYDVFAKLLKLAADKMGLNFEV